MLGRDNSVSVSQQPGRPRVLVVDDDLSCRLIVVVLLEAAGYSPSAVGTVDRALDRLDTEGADLVITDLIMPRRDGLDLLESLRHRIPSVPAIAMTAADDETLVRRAFELGATAVLIKPFPAQRLEEAVRAALPGETMVDRYAAA
jgi:CheY-like chemotaxis protein